jgi:RNA polymerase sigma-70 factor (ECF subfamily)
MEARDRESDPQAGAERLSDLYDEALPEVYRYLRSRCGSTPLAEDLTSSVFIQAALTIEREPHPPITTGWLVTVARNKLIDHWRRQARAERSLTLLEGGIEDTAADADPWDAVLDQTRAAQVLAELPPHYRAALTLRYFDDLNVPECAELLGRSVRATESLLVRARSTFRTLYEKTGGRDD